MLEQVVGDRPHALGHRLVLRVDALDAGVVAAVTLRIAVDQPVILGPAAQPPAPVPVGRVRQIVEGALKAGHRAAVPVRAERRRVPRHIRLTNIVWLSSIGTQARLCRCW